MQCAQVKGWQKHKSKCRPWQITRSPIIGRYLIATRDIKAGEIIIDESAIMLGPKQITEPVCLTCYRPVDGSYMCSNCGFPMCDADCQSSDSHEPECKAVQRSGRNVKVTVFGEINSLYECITPLRILHLRDNDKSTWERILCLESHSEEREQTESAAITQRTVVDIIIERLQILEFDADTIQKIVGILDTNAFEIRLPDSSIQGVYGEGAMMEHSCVPNTHRTFDADLKLVIRAAVNIKRGEHLTNCYTDSISTTQARQEHLLLSKYFTCNCARCLDPTEFGIYMSAIKCPECRKKEDDVKPPKKGKNAKSNAKNDQGTSSSNSAESEAQQSKSFAIAKDPLSPSSPWVCQKCSSPVDGDYVKKLTAVMVEEADELESGSPTISACEAFLHKWSTTFPEKHATFLNVSVCSFKNNYSSIH